MAQGSGSSYQNPYRLLLLEILIHIPAAGLLYLHLPDSLDANHRYLVLGVIAAAIALRAISSLLTSSENAITGNYGQPTGVLPVISALLLGLSWGGLTPALDYLQLDFTRLAGQLPLIVLISAVALFAGSALNTRLLISFALTAMILPIAVLGERLSPGELLAWGLTAAVLLVLARAASGLGDLIERFLQISRGNTDLVKNLAKTRDEAVSARESAEKANVAIQAEIAEREKAEQQIKASERELSRILDDMMDTYFQVTTDGRISRISPSVEFMLGYATEEIYEMNWKALFASAEEHAAFSSAIEANFGVLENYETRLRHQQGNEVWVTLNAHYREDPDGRQEGFEGIARDSTEARASKENLFQEKELWRVTLASIADGVITTDIAGRVSYVNPVAESMTGWDNQAAQKLPLLEVMQLVNENNREPVVIPIREWLEAGREATLHNPAILMHRDGETEAAIELSGSPIRDSQERIIGSVMVFHDVTKLRALAMQLSYQATHDALTGLINRVEFDARVEQAIHSANQAEKQHALFYLDLDQFKTVNDTSGHPAGDELLRQITRIFRSNLRESDVLARLGGDEFGVLLLGCPLDKAREIAEKLRKQVEDFRFRYEGNEFRVGTSIGLVPITDRQTPLTELMKSADAALYVAKEQGRNRVHVSVPDDKEIAIHHGQLQWMQRIQRAVEENEFALFSQTIVSIEDDAPQPRHAELLLRLIENRGTENEKVVPPAAFLPAAERYHLMPLIDRWVLDKALHKLASTDVDSASLGSCSINLSGQSLTDLKLYNYILELLTETKVDPQRICFEITESAVIANMDVAKRFVDGLRKLGCRFALDDFGSGLSTFDYLKQLNVDYVKLDGSLVRDVATSRVSQAMVHAVNYVAHVMGMKSIAEFVESDDIMRALKKLSVDYAQGYAIDKPKRFLN